MSNIPENIYQLQNLIFEKGYSQRDRDFRHFFTGGRHVSSAGDEVFDVWDVTDYTPDGKHARVLDDINYMIAIADWEQLPNAEQVDMSYAREICLSKAKPALVLTNELSNGQIEYQIADGNHRIAKAQLQRRREYPAHVLSLEESNAIKLPQKSAKIVWLDALNG